MATMSVSVPEELRQKLSELDEINWSAVARKAFEAKVTQIEIMKKLSAKSKLTEKDAFEISEKINKNMAKKFKEMK